MHSSRPSACFAGTRIEALNATRRYLNVLSIVTVPDSWVHRNCTAHDLPVQLATKIDRETAFQFLAEQNVKYVISAGFPFIIPDYVLNSGAVFINSHPALLPAYKGYNAIREAVKNGEEYMGVTLHHMVAELDAGEGIWQERVWVRGLTLQEIYDLIFGVVEPMAITRALEILLLP